MLTPPAISEQTIRDYLGATYGVATGRVEFLPLGADINTAVYRVSAPEGEPYFLKLRRGDFDDAGVRVPAFLRESGAWLVMAPLADLSGHLYSYAHEFYWRLYPYIEGRDGYEVGLSPAQWVALGANLAIVHRAVPPPELAERLLRETYTPALRDVVRAYHAQVARTSYADPIAAQFASLWTRQRGEIMRIVERAERLAAMLRERELEFVVCHADLHPGNLLIGEKGELAIVDWDHPARGPKERDLLFVGGGIGGTWNTLEEDRLFYEGYQRFGSVEIDPLALSYYHYERIVADLAAYADELLGVLGSAEDRARSLGQISSQFEPSGVIELAHRHYPLE